MNRIVLIILCLVTLSACNGVASNFSEPPVNEVLVSKALEDIAAGFSNMKAKLDENEQILGVFPCKITLNLRLTIGKRNDNSLVVNFDPVNIKNTATVDSKRDNTIVIELYNPSCLPEKTLGYDKPDKIFEAFKGMAGQKSSKPASEDPSNAVDSSENIVPNGKTIISSPILDQVPE